MTDQLPLTISSLQPSIPDLFDDSDIRVVRSFGAKEHFQNVRADRTEPARSLTLRLAKLRDHLYYRRRCSLWLVKW